VVFERDEMSSVACNSACCRAESEAASIVRAISVDADPVAFAVGADAIWVVNSCDGSVSRVDPATNTVTNPVRVGHRPLRVAVAARLGLGHGSR
jgi:YVTN family beta-propeller protein